MIEPLKRNPSLNAYILDKLTPEKFNELLFYQIPDNIGNGIIASWDLQKYKNAYITLRNNKTLEILNPTEGDSGILIIYQDSVGGYNLTFPNGSYILGSLNTIANAKNIISYYYDENLIFNIVINYGMNSIGYVPYTGANTTVDLNTQNLIAGKLNVNNIISSGIVYNLGNNGISSNTSFGIGALTVTTGGNNTGFGNLTLTSNVTGINNTAVGGGALLSSNSNNNTAVGFSSLILLTTGVANSAIGVNSGYSLISGNQNTYFGLNAGFSNDIGNNNIAIGYSSLYNATSNNNTAIGFNTALGVTTGSNNTILGANVTGLSPNLSNNIILSDGQGNVKYQWDGTSNNFTGSVKITGRLNVSALPTSSVGLVTGDIWNNAGTLKIV